MNYTEAAFRALEQKAIEYAARRHANQTYGGDKPYTFHLKQVRDVVLRFHPFLPFNVSVEMVAVAAWLHDTIEDTGSTHAELEGIFGKEVADTVWKVTNEPGKNHKERAIATYPKIASSDASIFLKLSDRIANIEAGGKTDMYRKEHADFKQALYKKGCMDAVWGHLDNLLKEETATPDSKQAV